MPMRSRSGRRSVRWQLLAVLVALGLVAAACGNDDDGATPTTEAADTDTTVADDDTTDAPAGEPVYGGKIVFGLEADTSSPWTPSKMVCAVSCHAIARSVYDTLTLIDENGDVIPNLATATPSDDFTQWSLTARDGVTFHDGTPFDGAAIVDNLTRQQNSFLTGKVLESVTSIDLDPNDPMTAIVTLEQPWVSFDSYLAAQVGYMASPTWLAAADENPALESQPVGTGPFVFQSYTPGEGYRGVRNDDYWRDGLPYLDEIEYRIIADGKTRENALLAGDIDAMHTSTGSTIADLREMPDRIDMDEFTQWGETSYWLMHVTEEGSPLTDRRVRCALAHATDIQAVVTAVSADVPELANGPYSPERIGYLAETGYPEFDPDAARALIEEYEAEVGPVRIAYASTNDAQNLLIAQLVQQMWEDVGVETTIEQIEQGQFIVTALQGNFQVFQWRNHGGADPDADFVWWSSSTALPVGQLALNFGRIQDDVIDENLEIIRTNPDADARKEAAENINRRFGEQCYNLWTSWTVWAIPRQSTVQGFGTFESADGTPVAAAIGTTSGAPYPQTLWVER